MKFTAFIIQEDIDNIKDWKSYIKRNNMLASAIKILENLTIKGYVAYLVGGCVRDIILGLEPHDIDIATNMPIDEISKIYKSYDIGKSKDFGIVVVREGNFSFEIANFRSDGAYTDGRRPESIKIETTFSGDASRRDFTINAMAIDAKGNIIDYFDGKKDIKNKTIKTVGDPKKRFGEDYLRILRAARFSSKLGFEIDNETAKAAKELSPNITKLSAERIRDEIYKAASQKGDKFANYLLELDRLGILNIILPEIARQKEFTHFKEHHPEGKYVWDHTIAALRTNKLKDPLINIAILLHDVGKPTTATIRDHGGMAYFGHAEAGINLVNTIADRLKISNEDRAALIFAVGNHMKFHLILGMKPSKVAKLVSDKNWDCLVAVARADEFSRGEKFIAVSDFEKIVDTAIEIKQKWGSSTMNKVIKLVDGNHVMKLLQIQPGPIVGKIIQKTTEWIINNNIDPADSKKIDEFILETDYANL